MSPFDLFGKIAAPEPAVEATESGSSHRRKAKQRGFYTDPSPSIYGMRSAFDSADRKAGKLAALKSFGLLHGKDGPVEALTELFKTEDFGLPRRNSRDSAPEKSNTRRPYTGC